MWASPHTHTHLSRSGVSDHKCMSLAMRIPGPVPKAMHARVRVHTPSRTIRLLQLLDHPWPACLWPGGHCGGTAAQPAVPGSEAGVCTQRGQILLHEPQVSRGRSSQPRKDGNVEEVMRHRSLAHEKLSTTCNASLCYSPSSTEGRVRPSAPVEDCLCDPCWGCKASPGI